ncbi:unnamed protein product [Candidula unifasciata]|uniref:Lipase domain-containing protein n=1 Tax=Candidula unifasciata TaxID=100452 RepID=A0A8S3Z149_9EUPU|nr:unnamed protein product [Candidula unifasciata]
MEIIKQSLCLLVLFNGTHMFLLESENEVCYDKLGCFSTADPFTSSQRPISVLPQSTDKIRTTYILYTRERRPEPQTLDARNPENILKVWPSFSSRPTKWIIHGFFQTVRTWSWMKELAEELLKFGDYNVIVVDWSGGNQFPYTQASANTRIVGAQIALLVNHLIEAKVLLTADDVHIIGHSLGAHIAGYAGERITGLGRISGLDPAGPYFRDTDPRVRLDETDAKFVDAMHTDVEQGFEIGLGTPTPSGHADFFPNGGNDQPGCGGTLVSEILKSGLVKGVADSVFCSHMRAVEFFNESINSPCPFLAFPCASEEDFEAGLCQSCGVVACSRMGFHADKYKPPPGQKVIYYLKTGAQAPFCLYHYTVTVTFSNGSWPSVSGRASVEINLDGFKSSWVSLTGDETRIFAPGQTATFYVDLPQNVGNVTALSFKWQKSFSLSTLFRDPSVSIEGIDVYAHESGARFKLCGQGRSVTSGTSVTFLVTC